MLKSVKFFDNLLGCLSYINLLQSVLAMKIPAFWRAIGLVTLYIGIFCLVVVMQFPLHGDISAAFGALSLRSGARAEGGPLESAVVDLAGLRFEFSARRPLVAVDASGGRKPGAPVSRSDLANGWKLAFDNGITLAVSASDKEGSRLSVVPSFKGDTASLELGYALVRGARIDSGASGLTLVSGGVSYALDLPASALDRKRRVIVLGAGNGRPRSFAALRERAGQPTVSPQVMAQAPMDPALYKKEIDAFVDKAWSGLSTTRFDPANLVWKFPAAPAAFTEKALTAYIAEAYRRGAGTQALERAKAANALYPASLSYLSSPFLGGILVRTKSLEDASLAEVKRLEKVIQDKPAGLFDRSGIALFLLDRAPYSLAQSAFQAVAAVDPGQLSERQAVNALAAFNDGAAFMKEGENPFERFSAVAEKVLLPAIKRFNDGFFLQSSPEGDSELLLSAQAGFELIRYGGISGRDVFVGVGQSLVTGVLALANAEGFVPLVLDLTGKDAPSSLLAPEELYPLVAGNPYYPHEVPFYRELGPGVWAWTCSPSIQAVAEPSRVVFKTEFPVGAAHHLVLYGIKPFANIQLYGIDYRPDASFEIYDVSGYYFNRTSNSMFLKMRHKTKLEEIRLFY